MTAFPPGTEPDHSNESCITAVSAENKKILP